MTKFSVNLNKVALLRNSRGRNTPDLLDVARRCLEVGVHGITLHPRPDERHARYSDVLELSKMVEEHPGVELNVEGNPMGRFMDLVLRARPNQVTLVPDSEEQLTSDHGWDARAEGERLASLVQSLERENIRSSLFLDADLAQVRAAAQTGASRIELYTEPYAAQYGSPAQAEVTARFAAAAGEAQSLGLGVNAGHDLSLNNLGYFLESVPGVLEVSIGHAVICESLELGLEATLRRYLRIVAGAR